MTKIDTQSKPQLGAILLGCGAVILWATLAALMTPLTRVPPFQVLAICFLIGGSVGLLFGRPKTFPRMPILVGASALFLYHLFYLLALRQAPAVEASLIAYLWPLLIVLMSSLSQRLRWFHVFGAVLGFVGAILIVLGGQTVSFVPKSGHALAALAALTWASYSVFIRRWSAVPISTVTAQCLGAAVFSGLASMFLETPVWPSRTETLALFTLGLGPVGLAFFLWDVGCKRGDLAVLGAASYAAPLLSTLLLISLGLAEPTWTLALACMLITFGAALAAAEVISPALRKSLTDGNRKGS